MKEEIASYLGDEAALTDEQKYQQMQSLFNPPLKRIQQVSKSLTLLVFGSDTPNGSMYTQVPGLNGNESASVPLADLLLLGKKPLQDVTAYDAINRGILRGKPFPRESLSAQANERQKI